MSSSRLTLPALLSICGILFPSCQVVNGVTCLDQPSSTIDVPNFNPRSIAISSAGKEIIVDGWGRNSPVCLVDVASRKVTILSKNSALPIACNEISRDGSMATFGTGSVAHIYSITGSPKHLNDIPYEKLQKGIRFSPNSKSIALISPSPANRDGYKEYLNLDVLGTGSWKRMARMKTEHWDDYLCFSKSGRYLAITSGCGPRNIEVWDWSKSKLVGKVTLNSSARLVADRDSESFVFAQRGKQNGSSVFKRVELPRMAVSTIADIKFECHELLFADREKVVVEASDDGSLNFKLGTLDISGSRKGTAKWYVSRKFDELTAAVDPTGKYLIVGDPGGKLLLFDLTK